VAKFAIIQNFYAGKDWRELRFGLIMNQTVNGKFHCPKCGCHIRDSKDIHGHHITELTPENVSNATISLNPDNVELICRDCHDQEHGRFGYQVEKNVYLVYGPPNSGKTTFVRQQMKRGDIIVDMDQLYAAISLQPAYDKPDNLFSNVINVQNLLIDHIKTRYGKWHNAWIVGGYADKHKRNRIAEATGAELVFLDVPKEECLLRLETDPDKQYRKAEWKTYIDKWFSQYSQ